MTIIKRKQQAGKGACVPRRYGQTRGAAPKLPDTLRNIQTSVISRPFAHLREKDRMRVPYSHLGLPSTRFHAGDNRTSDRTRNDESSRISRNICLVFTELIPRNPFAAITRNISDS